MSQKLVKFPSVRVRLTGQDGNAFMVLGLVQRAMKKGGCTPAEINAFIKEATGGDYNNLLATVMRTVTVD